MRYSEIKNHLKPYSILARRKTTITNAFASAIAHRDIYDDVRVRKAIVDLGQVPDKDLFCVYCDDLAETWDHVFGIVLDREFSGHGHTLGNLLPCCKLCNSRKGNKFWDEYLDKMNLPDALRNKRKMKIQGYLDKYPSKALISKNSPDYQKFYKMLDKILKLMGEADFIASRILAENQSAQLPAANP